MRDCVASVLHKSLSSFEVLGKITDARGNSMKSPKPEGHEICIFPCGCMAINSAILPMQGALHTPCKPDHFYQILSFRSSHSSQSPPYVCNPARIESSLAKLNEDAISSLSFFFLLFIGCAMVFIAQELRNLLRMCLFYSGVDFSLLSTEATCVVIG